MATAKPSPETTQAVQGAPLVTGDFTKQLKHTTSLRVVKVIDAQTILMNDGKIVRLSGIGYPFIAGTNDSDVALTAKLLLEKLLAAGTDVLVYQTRKQTEGRVNRMGHLLAHLVTKKNGEWINGVLLKEGLAWAEPDALNPQMAAQMYALEQQAREAKKFIWSDKSPYGVLTPETAARGAGTFRVIEGTVKRASTSKNSLFLNFGTDWRKDFTVMVSPAVRKALSREGVDPIGLTGRKIRVRGWLREWNGPFLELETPERLEILSAASASSAPPAENGQ